VSHDSSAFLELHGFSVALRVTDALLRPMAPLAVGAKVIVPAALLLLPSASRYGAEMSDMEPPPVYLHGSNGALASVNESTPAGGRPGAVATARASWEGHAHERGPRASESDADTMIHLLAPAADRDIIAPPRLSRNIRLATSHVDGVAAAVRDVGNSSQAGWAVPKIALAPAVASPNLRDSVRLALSALQRRRSQFHLDTAADGTSPGDIMTALYVALGLLLFARYVILKGRKVAKLAEVYVQRDSLVASFDSLTKDVDGILRDMQYSNALIAERNLDAKRREFEKFLARCNKAHSKKAGLLMPLRNFIARWLYVFEDCSFDPVNQPNILLTEKELKRPTTTSGLIELVLSKLSINPIHFVKGRVDEQELFARASTQNKLPAEDEDEKEEPIDVYKGNVVTPLWGMSWVRCAPFIGCGWRKHKAARNAKARWQFMAGCCSLTVLSCHHAILLLVFCAGVMIVTMNYLLSKIMVGSVGILGVILVLVVLMRYEAIDELSTLESHMAYIEMQTSHVQHACDAMLALNSRLQMLMDLWRFRTFPCFELIQELSEQCLDCPAKQLEHLLNGAGDELSLLQQQLGPVSLWCGETLDEHVERAILTQFKATAKFVRSFEDEDMDDAQIDSMVHGINGTLGFVGVRAIAAHHLPNLDSWTPGDLSDPYVKLRVGGQSAWSRTETVKDNLNPVWPDSQFLLGAPFHEGVLELEVRDDDHGRSEPIGVLMLGFRDLKPGVWHSVCKALCAPKGKSKDAPILYTGASMLVKGNPSDGSEEGLGFLELEIQYANEMRQILSLSTAMPKPPQSDTQIEAS